MNKPLHKRQLNRPISQPARCPYQTLNALFSIFNLTGIRKELDRWMQQAAGSLESAFEQEDATRALVAFCAALRQLTEALWLLHLEHLKQMKAAGTNSQVADISAIALAFYAEKLALESMPHDALDAIRHFYKSYAAGFANVMLLDMLEAILLAHKGKKLKQPDLVFFYRAMRGLIKAGKEIYRHLYR